ncbi:MAG: hypothetical protein LBN23_06085 [Paludibacter sp.]|jgi:hypothetical protein|nr:hypothetical protein [Paludibacter sp.]
MWNIKKIKNQNLRVAVSTLLIIIIFFAVLAIFQFFDREENWLRETFENIIKMWLPFAFFMSYRNVFGSKRKNYLFVIVCSVVYIPIASIILTVCFEKVFWKALIGELIIICLFATVLLMFFDTWKKDKVTKT